MTSMTVNIAIEMYTAIPRSYLWVVPNKSHGPIAGDRGARFIETASVFLRSE